MRVSDYILDFLVAHNVQHVFGITGGMITPLFDAFHGRTDIEYICNQHEQASAMAAEAYARFRGFGCAIATSGPGATNLLTGIGCAYFDSIPVLYITGQVNTKEARGNSQVRQKGFQETDIVSIVKPVVKYAHKLTDPNYIAYILEMATYWATSGRPGPALIDIPIDVLQAEIDPATIPHCVAPVSAPLDMHRTIDLEGAVAFILPELLKAKRPVIIYGAGVRKYKAELLRLLERTHIPCLPSWAALDLIDHDHPQYVGTFGVYGSRAGNFTVQTADYILALGTRLDTRMTGSSGFAPDAKKVIVDIDKSEADKNAPNVGIVADAGAFLRELLEYEELDQMPDYSEWAGRITTWKEKYPLTVPVGQALHPIDFVRILNSCLPEDAAIVSDAGANLAWVHQAIHLNGTQRLWSAYGNSPMGYALPAAIGAYYATGKLVICCIGDGGIQMNIQELQTLKRYNIPVKIFIFNNEGYGIIRQFQEEIFEGRYEATDKEHGVSNPNFLSIAWGYGLKCAGIDDPAADIAGKINLVLTQPGAWLVNVAIDPKAGIFPKTRFGQPLQNQYPFLPAEEVAENMRQNEREERSEIGPQVEETLSPHQPDPAQEHV